MTKLPELPRGWCWATLGELALSIRNGVFVSRPAPEPPGTRILRISSVRPNALDPDDVRYANPEPDRATDYFVQPGDLLFTRYSGNPAYVGACAVVGQIAAPTLHPDKLIRVVVDPKAVNPWFVQYAVNGGFCRSEIEHRLKTTAGQVGIAGSQLRTVPVPIAPRAEQDRIVGQLEEHLSRVDAAATILQAAVARMPYLDRSILAVAQQEGGETELGDLLIDIEAGKSFRTPGRPAAADEWGVIKVSAMTWGDFRPDENKAVPEGQPIDRRFEIRPGDLLLSRANTSEYVGASVLVGDCRPGLLLSDKSMRLLPRVGVDKRWLRYALGSPQLRSQMSLLASGTSDSMRNISQEKVRSLRIRVPELPRQLAIAQEIESASMRRHRLLAECGAISRLAGALRRSILSAAFAGQLVRACREDEPAPALLHRLRAGRSTSATTGLKAGAL